MSGLPTGISKLEAQFDEAMMSIYRRAKSEAGYNAKIFLDMLLKDRGILTAKKLINARTPSDGYTALFERDRLDLTVEALVIGEARWHSLFEPEEIDRCRLRLKQYGYVGMTH